MTSKERVRAAIEHKHPDMVPTNFEGIATVVENLLKYYNFNSQVQHFIVK